MTNINSVENDVRASVSKAVRDSSSVVKDVYQKVSNMTSNIIEDVGNYFSNRSVLTGTPREDAERTVSAPLVTFEHLHIIGTLPPKYDNIVDPPTEWNDEDFKYKLTTLFAPNRSSATVGRAYTKNFLMNGNFVTFVPIKLDPDITDISSGYINKSLGAFGAQVGTSIAGLKPGDLYNSFQSILSIGGYGYATKVAGKAYWRHVAANMKVILYALGIDLNSDKLGSDEKNDALVKALPNWIKQNLTTNTFNKKWGLDIDTSETKSIPGLSEDESKKFKDLTIKEEELKNSIKKDASDITKRFINTAKDKVNNSEELREIQEAKRSLEAKANMPKEFSEATQQEYVDDMMSTKSKKLLRKWILAASPDSKDSSIQDDLPLITFYVNGPIEKSYGASQSVSESELGSILSGNYLKGFGEKVAQNLGEMGREKGNAKLAGAADLIGAALGSNVPTEVAYLHGGDNAAVRGFLNSYVPRVNKGVDGDISYQINLRSIADGSDAISLALHLYNLALLMPFYIEPAHKGFQSAFVPKSPLLVSAFSKGIFNIPRGVISNIDIKSDPVFQTTESISTDLEFSLTLTPLINKGFSPDFEGFFNRNADQVNLMMAMFNPFSSFNILVTMCGMNTTMTKINHGLFTFFIEKNTVALATMAYESYEGLKSQLVDIKSTTLRNMNLSKATRPN